MRPLGPPHAPGSMQHRSFARNISYPAESYAKLVPAFWLALAAQGGNRESGELLCTSSLPVTSLAALKCKGIVSCFGAA
jgi:hypothetical protein